MTEKRKTIKNSNKNVNQKNKNIETKKQVKQETSNKKIIITALLFALVLGIFSYFQIAKDNDSKEGSNNKEQIIENQEDDEEEILKEEEPDNNLGYITNEVVKVEKPQQEEIIEDMYYFLEFETNGGNDIDKQILSDKEITSNVLPVREGWSFAGWYKDAALTEEFIFGRTLTEDTILYAKWAKFIVFKVDGVQFGEVLISYENEVIDLLSKDDLGDIVENEYEVAWMLDTTDEFGNIISSEVIEGTILNSENIKVDSDTIELNLRKLSKFNVEFYLSSSDEEAVHIQEVVESRPIDFTEVNEKINQSQTEEYGWYYIDEEQIKWNFFEEQVATPNITKLYLDGVYTVTYTKDDTDFDSNVNTEDEILESDEDISNIDNIDSPQTNIEEDSEEENLEESTQISDEDSIIGEVNDNILKEIKVAKDTRITSENIFAPEKIEGYEFIGWFLVDEVLGVTDIMLTENMVIDRDKVFVAKWEKIEEVQEVANEEQSIEEQIPEDEPVQESENND